MKRILGIGLVTAALLAGCGGAANTPADTGANPTVDTAANPTLATGAGDPGDTLPDATAAANETSVTGADATTGDATAMATSATGSDTTTGATAMPTSATGATAAATPEASTDGSTTGSTAPTMTGSYQPAGIPELGLSFQVPDGWEQVDGENAWSPAGVDIPRVGVQSADLTDAWKPSDFLPTSGTVISSQQINVAGMQAMFYTVQNSDGTAETHAIMRSGEKAYDFYARAETIQDLRTIEPVLSDIVGSVQFSGA